MSTVTLFRFFALFAEKGILVKSKLLAAVSTTMPTRQTAARPLNDMITVSRKPKPPGLPLLQHLRETLLVLVNPQQLLTIPVFIISSTFNHKNIRN